MLLQTIADIRHHQKLPLDGAAADATTLNAAKEQLGLALLLIRKKDQPKVVTSAFQLSKLLYFVVFAACRKLSATEVDPAIHTSINFCLVTSEHPTAVDLMCLPLPNLSCCTRLASTSTFFTFLLY